MVSIITLLDIVGVANAEVMAYREMPINVKVDVLDTVGEVLSFNVKSGELIKVELYAVGGTGYEWVLVSKDDLRLVEITGQLTEPVDNTPGLTGGKVRTTFILKAKEGLTGKEMVDFSLRRSWESADMAVRKLSCEVTVR